MKTGSKGAPGAEAGSEIKGRVGAREALSRQRIFDAALLIADRDGAGAVTMRRVAREVGVEAMSLYHHIRDREDLLDGLAETMVHAGLPAPNPGTDAAAIISAFANGIRRTGLAHPQAFGLVGLRPLRNDDATAAIARLLDALSAAGVTAERAVLAYRSAAAFARGFVLSEIAGLTYGAGTEPPETLTPYASALQQDTGGVFDAALAALVSGLFG